MLKRPMIKVLRKWGIFKLLNAERWLPGEKGWRPERIDIYIEGDFELTGGEGDFKKC